MSRILMLVLLSLSCSVWAAGPHDRPPADRDQRFAELVEQLSLTDAQQGPVRQALQEHRELMRELGRGNREQRDELETQLVAELATLLDADQLQRWQAFRESHRPPRSGERRPHRDSGGPQGHSRPG